MLRTGRICRDERQVNVRLCHAGKLDLRLLCRFLQALCRHLILRKVDAVFLLEFFNHPIHDLLVKVIAA